MKNNNYTSEKMKNKNYSKTMAGIFRWVFSLLIVLGLSTTNANAQTVLISPTGDGGFETGTTFVANGWSTAADNQNIWYCGTVAKTAGLRGAYIDVSASGGAGNTYIMTATKVSYIYRSVTFPVGATNIILSFKWRCVGENSGGANQYDWMRVFVSSATPVGGTLLGSGSVGLGKYNSSSATVFSTEAGIDLSSFAGTTQVLAFCWRNDASGGTNPPAAIDEVSLTYTPPSPLLAVTALTAFGNVCTNTTAGPNSFTITGTNLTSANITVAALSGFTYSTTSGGSYSTTLSLTQPGGSYSQVIFVKFNPTLVQSYSGNIVIGGGGASSINEAASGSGVNTAPSSTSGAASAITTTGATVAGTLVAGCTSTISYGIEYSITNGFANGTGAAVPASNLAGGSFSSTLSGLSPGTVYYYHSYATNSGGTGYGAQGSFTTLCVNATLPYSQGFNAITIPVCWSQQFITGTSNILYQASSSNPSTVPQEGADYVYWDSYSITNNNETRLVSTPITTTGKPSVDVNFYWDNDNNTSYNSGQYLTEGVTVQYSTDGTTWTDVQFVARHDASLTSGTSQWKLKSITLPAGAGNLATVYVGFKFHSGFGDNCSLDNLVIQATPPVVTSISPFSTCVGQTVTISGTGFTGATAVTFNGTTAITYSVINSTTITATVPAGATSGAIAVTTPGGTSITASLFAITTIPAPTSSNGGPYCSGATATLIASGLAPGGTVASFTGTTGTSAANASVSNSFTMDFWVKPVGAITINPQSTSATTGLTGQKYAVMPLQSGTNAGAGVSVGTNGISVYEHGNGYISPLLSYTFPATITTWTHVAVVYTSRTPSLYINGSKVATGLTSTFGSFSYPSIGSDGTGGANYGAFTGSLDDYRIWNGSLTQTEIVSIMFNPAATTSKTKLAQYKFDASSVTDGVGGNPNWNTPSSFAAPNYFTYTWTGTNAPAGSTAESQTTTGSLTSNQNYTVIANVGGSCPSVSSAATTVIVNQRPTASLSGTATICNGGSSSISISVTGSGTISGTLSPGAIAFSGTAPTITVSVSPTSNTTYSVATLTDANCTSIAGDLTGTRTVNVNARPTASLSGSATICNGLSSSISITVTGTGTKSGTLSPGAIPFSGSTSPITVSVSPTSNTTYTVATLSDANCTSIAADLTGSRIVNVNARPTASVSGTTTICNGGSSSISISVTGSGTISGTLSPGAIAFSGTAPTISVNVSPTSNTTYTVATLSDANCTSIAADLTGSRIVNVNNSPIISACPLNIAQCDNHVATFSTPTATGTPTPSVVCVPASGSTFATGTTLVTCTATNSCGTSSCSFNVTINETPVIGACPSDITQCDNNVATFSTPTATGTPAASIVCVPASGSTFATGTTLVTCTATNSCGTSSCSFNVTINETPVIGSCPSDITQCDNSVATFSIPTATGTPSASVVCVPASGSTFATGTTLVTCTATNSCGSSSCSFNVTVNESPVIGSCPADFTVCDNLNPIWTDPTATGTPALTVACVPASGSTFATGTTLVTCTATNSCGSSSCSFNVTVNESPVIGSCPSDITQCDNNVVTFSTPAATGTPTPTVACVPTSGSTFATGTTLVTCTATNSCGTSSCSFNVTVNESPVIGSCPADFTVCDNLNPTWTDPTATGTPAASVVCVPASGSTFATGTTLVTCTATNSCGTSSCSFNVTINETPVISACPSDITQCDNHVATFSTPTATGTPTPTVACVPASGSSFSTGTTLVTCTATNSCGSSNCSFNVTINETPVIGACPSDITQCDNHVATFSTPTATGTPTPSVVCVPASGSTFAMGTTLVTCTAINSCGTSSCSFNVTINETPVIGACPSDITQCDNHVATFSTPTATGTPAASVVCLPASGSTFATGTTLVTCTATNSCGSSSCSFNVTINDSPIANAGADQSICYTGTAQLAGSIGGGASSSTWTRSGDGTFDNASLPNAVYTPGPSDIINGIVTLTLTTDDPQGPCSSAADQMILTILTSPPSKPATPSGPTVACVGNVFNYTIPAVPTAASYTWTSLLPGYASIAGGGTAVSINFFGSLPGGTSYYPFSLIATNACGNSLARSFSIQNKISVPSFTTGLPVVVCQNTNSVSYSVVPLGPGITYTWTITGSGATINGSNTGSSINVDFVAHTTVTISVTATNACMTTAARSMIVTSSPTIPGAITGPTYVCPGGTYSYSVPAVPGASSYVWTAPAGSSIAGNSNSVSITFGGTIPGGATVGVSSLGNCANSSAARTKGIGNGKPNTPGNISGLAAGQCGQTGVSYSIAPVLSPVAASSYTWTANNGASISGPNNLSGVTIDFPANFVSATLTVTANNACGSSSARALVVGGVPNTPTSISSSSNNFTPCNTDIVTYCAVGSINATSYTWTIPAGATILGSATGSCILVQWSLAGGTLTSKALNGCGQSGTKTQAVTINCREAQITGTVDQFKAEVYPNPATDKATLKFTVASADQYHLNITDVIGQNVLNISGEANEGINTVDIDLSTLAKGMYILNIMSGYNTEQIKVVVQ